MLLSGRWLSVGWRAWVEIPGVVIPGVVLRVVRPQRKRADMDATTQAIRFMPRPRKGALARLGDAMQRHRRAILSIQWVIVVFYAALVVLPAFLPHPSAEARLFSGNGEVAIWYERLVLFAQYLFWGVWWPFVILSIMLVGRVWCGVLCPEGALA